MKAINFSFILIVSLAAIVFSCGADDSSSGNTNPILISLLDLSVDEGNNYSTALVKLQLDAAADQPITANISTGDGTAEANKDYIPVVNQALVFAPGETEKTVEVIIAGDLIFEEDEFFEVTIVSVAGPATISDATARVDVLNDDVIGSQGILVIPQLDWNAVKNLAPDAEVPFDACNFGQPSSIPNEEFTSVAMVNDTVFFVPKINPAGDTLLYLRITFEDNSDWEEYVAWTAELVSPGDSVGTRIIMPIINNDSNDKDLKYDLHMMIGTDQGRFGPYAIDPKIRIQGS